MNEQPAVNLREVLGRAQTRVETISLTELFSVIAVSAVFIVLVLEPTLYDAIAGKPATSQGYFAFTRLTMVIALFAPVTIAVALLYDRFRR